MAFSENSGKSHPHLQLLSTDELEKLHNSALKILEKVGVDIFEERAVELLEERGVAVESGRRVKIPSHIVRKALDDVPNRINIYDSEGQMAMVLEGKNSFYGTGSDTPYTIDPFTEEKRKAVKEDVGKFARLCDELDNIDFVMSMGLASDVNDNTADRHHFEQMITNTSKPIIFTAWDIDGLKDIYEMCCIVAGGENNFQRKPFAILYTEPTTPLRHSKDSLKKLLFAVKKGIPVIYAPGASLGGTTPVTLAGAIALTNAEFLSGLVIAQLESPGSKVIYGGGKSAMDMRTAAYCYGAPEDSLNDVAQSELSNRLYNLPVFGKGGCSDAKVFDEQSAIEATYSLFANTLSGTNLIHDIGYLESGMTSSPQQVVVGNEIVGMVKRFVRGFAVNDEAIALDTIEQVGPGGNFISTKHTLGHFKDSIWLPKLFNRDNYENWVQGGRKHFNEVVSEKTKGILERRTAPNMSQRKRKEIEDVFR